MVPFGTVLKDVYLELNDGNVTFGRQIGSYPLLIGIPYRMETDQFVDVFVTEWGFRSITGISYPFDINHMPMSSLEALPGIGKKRASKLVMARPFNSMEELAEVIEDPAVFEKLKDAIILT